MSFCSNCLQCCPDVDTSCQQFEQNYDDELADDVSRPPTSNFSWPPPPEENGSRNTPTASPLYLPPPGTQHIKPKSHITNTNEHESCNKSAQVEDVIDIVPASWLTQQSRSAPELTTVNLKEHNELNESCSESYTSTCTTTTRTSEEYQRMYNTQAILTQSQYCYDQSSVDLNSNYDYEIASIQQQHGSFSSASTDLISFSGRRSVQECSDALYNTVETCQLVDYIKDSVPNAEPSTCTPKLAKKVEFADTVTKVDINRIIQSVDLPAEITTTNQQVEVNATSKIDVATSNEIEHKVNTLPPSKILNPVLKEWTSQMCRALTTASDKPFHIPDIPDTTIQCSDFSQECQQKCSETETCCKTIDVEVACLSKKTTEEPSESLDLSVPPIKGFIASHLITAPSNPFEYIKPIGDPVALPEETVAYFPPPISMEPTERHEPHRTKSPFLDALTTASLRSYTPFENDVITQFEDLPKPTQDIKLVDALTTAPKNPVCKLNSELPDETETEEIARIEAKRLEKQATEIRELISKTVETQLSKNISAFAAVTGFRSVNPFKPMSYNQNQSTLQSLSKYQSRSSSVSAVAQENAVQKQQSFTDQSQSKFTEKHRTISACSKESNNNSNLNNNNHYHQSTKRPIVFPPPAGTPVKSYIQSGLQNPKTIPKYQRQWFNLPSQSPIRTPEPPELKENVPLAFVDVPHEQSEKISKPFAITISATTATENDTKICAVELTQEKHSTTPICKSSDAEPTTVSSLGASRTGPITMTFQTIDPNQLIEPPQSTTPSLLNRPAPMIPYYQQHLVAEKCAATSANLFDPRHRTPSPRPDSVQSPAPGPPPNPLKIHAPRITTPDSLELASTLGIPSIITGESGLKFQNQSNKDAQLICDLKRGIQMSSRSFISTPETVCKEHCAGLNIETHSKANQLNESKKSDIQSSSTTQIGNVQVQRNRRVVEEFEHTQKAQTVEIYKSSVNTQQQIQNEQKICHSGVENSCGKGFVSRQARRLSEAPLSSQNNIVSYHFPHTTSPLPTSGFPVINDYNNNFVPSEISSPPIVQKTSFPPPINPVSCKLLANNQCVNSNSKLCANLTAAASIDCSAKSFTNTTTAQSNVTIAQQSHLTQSSAIATNPNITVPANKPPLTVANAYKPENNLNFKPNPSTGSGFKPPIANNQCAVVSDPSPASAGTNKGSSNVVATSAPKRGRGVLNSSVGPGVRVPQCGNCSAQIR